MKLYDVVRPLLLIRVQIESQGKSYIDDNMAANLTQKPQSIRDVINLRRDLPRYSSGIKKLDVSLYEQCGFRSGLIYDLNCVPGNVGKWELIFRIIMQCLQKENTQMAKKILIVQTFDQIPWFKMRRSSLFQEWFVDHIQTIQVRTLSQLIVLLQNGDFSKYRMVLIDGFQDLCRINRIEIQKQMSRNRKRRRENASRSKYSGPLQRLQCIIGDIIVTLSSIASKDQLVVVTTGNFDVFNQRIRQEELNTDNGSSEDSDTESSSSLSGRAMSDFFIQRIMVPVVSLQDHVSELYANRIILYNDWILKESSDGSVRTGLDKSTSITKYIELLEHEQIKTAPHFLVMLCGPNRSAGQRFTEGWFEVDPNTFDVVDADTDVNDEESVLRSTPLIESEPSNTDEIADSQ